MALVRRATELLAQAGACSPAVSSELRVFGRASLLRTAVALPREGLGKCGSPPSWASHRACGTAHDSAALFYRRKARPHCSGYGNLATAHTQLRTYCDGGKTVEGEDQGREGNVSKFKRMFRKYGPLFVGFYGSLYVCTLGTMYLCVDQGVIDSKFVIEITEQYADLLKQYGMDGIFNHGKVDGKAGSFAIAWIATKFTEPVRFGISVYCVPKLARVLFNKRG